jgi:hypothetical protein
MLPGIQKGFEGGWSIPQPAMYRGSKGFFRGFSQLREMNPHLMTTEAPFEQGAFEFPRETEGDLPRAPHGEPYPKGLWGPTKAYFGRAEQALGKNVPVFTEMWHPVTEQNTRAIEFNNSRMNEAKTAFQPHRFRDLDKFQAWLEMPDKRRASQLLQFRGGDDATAHELNRVWDRTFHAYGLEDGLAPGGMTRAEQHLTEYMPKMRQARYDLMSRGNPEPSQQEILNEAFPTAVPKSVQFFRGAIEDESIGISDTNPAAVLGKHLKAGSYKTWVEQYASDASRRFANNPQLPDGLQRATRTFLNNVKGGYDTTGYDIAAWIYQSSKKMGYPISVKASRSFMDSYIMAQYGSTLGFRPGPIMRNYLQTWQTGFSELGPRWYMAGVKAANTDHGRVLAAQLGLHAGDPGLVSQIMSRSGGIPKDVAGLAKYAFGRVTERGLTKYSSTDELNRNVMGLGQYARSLDAMGRANGNASAFIDYAKLNTGLFQPGERQVLTQLAHDGKFMEAARQSSIALADNTQWSYRPEMRAPATTGTVGRGGMAFFNWGSFYANYLKRLASPADFKLDPWFQSARLSRFMVANGMIYGAAVAAGSAAGLQHAWKRPLNWLFINPAIPSGMAPITKQVYTGVMSLNEITSAELAGQYQKQFAWSMATDIPGFSFMRDFAHVIHPRKGKTHEEEVLQGLGLQPGMQP